MNWDKGFSAKYYATVVDPESWEDTEVFKITGGGVSNKESGLRQSADVTCRNRRPQNEQWIRVYMEAYQSGDSDREPLFTGLAISPERDIDGGLELNPMECYSVLKASEDVLLDRGWFAPAGAPGAEVIRQLLSMSTPAPLEIAENSPVLADYVVAEENENCLSMAETIAEAIGWTISIKGDGTIRVKPRSPEPVKTLGENVIRPKLNYKDDWYSCPNVLRVSVGDDSVVVKDESDSIFSIKSRGREVWAEESDKNLNGGESAEVYAERRLKELQQRAITVSYTRRFDPSVLVGDVVHLDCPSKGIIGDYVVTSQKVELGTGAHVDEEVERIV